MTDADWKSLFGTDREHHKVRVYNREDFEAWAESDKGVIGGDYAIIEIYTGPKGKPVLDPEVIKNFNKTVIALDFDDYPEDVKFPGSGYQPVNPTITYKQAEELVRFIEWNCFMGRDFIIHCDAGVSRSQQVATYIMLTHQWAYDYDEENSSHTHHHAHTIVLSRLLETRHRLIPGFNDKNDEFRYDRTLERWVLKA